MYRDIHRLYGVFQRWFRSKRMRQFEKYFGPTQTTTVLDVGGTPFNWTLIKAQPRLTLVNLSSTPPDLPWNISWMIADGRNLPFPTNSFDVCYSNSVIEHLGTPQEQQAFADEIRRVGRSYYVQTPNYWFFVEPHLITPFIHWLPATIRRRLLRNFTVWGLLTRPGPESCDKFVREVRLLTKKEMKELFPDAEILVERFVGLSKSFIAIKQRVDG